MRMVSVKSLNALGGGWRRERLLAVLSSVRSSPYSKHGGGVLSVLGTPSFQSPRLSFQSFLLLSKKT